MSQYYKPHRKPDWNYGGPRFRLSRSKIDLFTECRRCFYIDNKLGVARPPGFPFSLNSAVDALLKKEFDIHRAAGQPHPLMEQYGIDAIPLAHPDLSVWQENFKGIEYFHEPTGFTISGAVDDIWVNPKGEFIVVDYKATSKDGKIEALDKDWHEGYKRQMEVYQWLLQQRGFDVSKTGYIVYANALKDRKAFDGRLEFEITVIAHTGSTDWIEPTIIEIKKCLDGGLLPNAGAECDYCTYRDAVERVLHGFVHESKENIPPSKKPAKKSKSHDETMGQLF